MVTAAEVAPGTQALEDEGPRSPAVAVTGSTGFVGEPLVHSLRQAGYRVVRISRGDRSEAGWVRWDPRRGVLDPSSIEGLHAVVHLAGEPIAGVRWTSSKKQEILRSREESTLLLSRALAALEHRPAVFLSASAVGFYGDRGSERLTETSGEGKGFLADVCRRWERAAHLEEGLGIRTVLLRTGQVLSPRGGLLRAVLLPFRLGLGGRIGSGRQYVSWVDLDDAIEMIIHALADEELRGPVNVTAPGPVPNATFIDVLGRVLGRPTLLPMPSMAVRAFLGEMGRELLLSGQRVIPERALATGYQFRFPDLEHALRHQLALP
ncbi:MAG: TIGR01777 family protein [Gemmatimonadetes bacterium]|nr:TIGR01777 family protein [Gemmatimonadota bacterium]